jgi:hypothetical protein
MDHCFYIDIFQTEKKKDHAVSFHHIGEMPSIQSHLPEEADRVVVEELSLQPVLFSCPGYGGEVEPKG